MAGGQGGPGNEVESVEDRFEAAARPPWRRAFESGARRSAPPLDPRETTGDHPHLDTGDAPIGWRGTSRHLLPEGGLPGGRPYPPGPGLGRGQTHGDQHRVPVPGATTRGRAGGPASRCPCADARDDGPPRSSGRSTRSSPGLGAASGRWGLPSARRELVRGRGWLRAAPAIGAEQSTHPLPQVLIALRSRPLVNPRSSINRASASVVRFPRPRERTDNHPGRHRRRRRTTPRSRAARTGPPRRWCRGGGGPCEGSSPGPVLVEASDGLRSRGADGVAEVEFIDPECREPLADRTHVLWGRSVVGAADHATHEARTGSPSRAAPATTSPKSSRDRLMEQPMLASANPSVAEVNTAILSTPASRARSSPRRFGTRAE